MIQNNIKGQGVLSMFRAKVEKSIGKKLSDSDYKLATDMAKDDIRFNKIGFGNKTPLKETVKITAMCAIAVGRTSR
jgi:hypothetical protein